MVHPRHRELQVLVDKGEIETLLGIVTLDDIAEAWVRFTERSDADVDDPDWWAYELVIDALYDRPHRRALLLKLVDRATSDRVVGMIGAGPLENFVSDDADDLSWLEQHCRNNPRLREALDGAWYDSHVSPASKARLDAAAGRQSPA